MSQLDYLSKPPEILPIRKIITPEVINYHSEQDIPVYEVRKEGCGITTIEIVYTAGRPLESTKLVSGACAALLREGAGPYTSEVISEELDFMGATLSISSSMDFITVKGVCLKQQLPRFLDIIGVIISEPHFKKEEWLLYKKKSIERLKVQLAKTDILSYRAVTEAIYGADHPYGYNSAPEYYDAVSVDLLREHHRQHLVADNCQIFVAGDITDEDRKMIDGLCLKMQTGEKQDREYTTPRVDSAPRQIYLPGGTHQSSIRIARKAFNRKHEDFSALNYVCNLLGGYFGSRLVSELREKRGLTYGIYSSMDSHLHDGDFMISTEVANENLSETLEGIYQEMDSLRSDLVSDEEIELVNNYMMGNYLNLFDGPFNSIRAIKSLALLRIPLDELDTLIKSSLSFDAKHIRDIAIKYLDRNDFWEVIVGHH